MISLRAGMAGCFSPRSAAPIAKNAKPTYARMMSPHQVWQAKGLQQRSTCCVQLSRLRGRARRAVGAVTTRRPDDQARLRREASGYAVTRVSRRSLTFGFVT